MTHVILGVFAIAGLVAIALLVLCVPDMMREEREREKMRKILEQSDKENDDKGNHA